MPNGIIYEEIRYSRSMHSITVGARWHWLLMRTTCDMWGRFVADPEIVLSSCYPFDPRPSLDTVAAWMDEIQKVETCIYYEDNGKLYGFHPNWKRWNKRSDTKPRHPDPPDGRLPLVSIRAFVVELQRAREAVAEMTDASQRILFHEQAS